MCVCHVQDSVFRVVANLCTVYVVLIASTCEPCVVCRQLVYRVQCVCITTRIYYIGNEWRVGLYVFDWLGIISAKQAAAIIVKRTYR